MEILIYFFKKQAVSDDPKNKTDYVIIGGRGEVEFTYDKILEEAGRDASLGGLQHTLQRTLQHTLQHTQQHT